MLYLMIGICIHGGAEAGGILVVNKPYFLEGLKNVR